MKKILLTVSLTIITISFLSGQVNCGLIDSVTFTMPESNQIVGRFVNLRGPYDPPQYLTYNEWHHLAITKENLDGKVFIDGNLAISGQWANNPFSWNSLHIGAALYTGWDIFFHGVMDEIRISNVVRSNAEIISGYNINQPYIADDNTIALWHFDEQGGASYANSVGAGAGTLFNGPEFIEGKFNNGIYFDGVDDRGNCNFNMPENNFTIELWLKPNGPTTSTGCFIQPYGAFNSEMYLVPDTIQTQYTWSTGDTLNSITVSPSDYNFIWVTDGTCTDTIWFNSQNATIYDTVTTFTTVTDTLIINTLITTLAPPANTNTIKVFPNPAGSILTIDYGNFALMNDYQLRIENSLGQQVFQTNISQQSDTLNLGTWGGNGLYFVHIVDPQGNTVDIRKIVLQ